MHPDASNSKGCLLLPKQTPGDRALKAFGIRHPVIHRQSSSCQHSPALPTAGSIFRLILVRGWTADCRTKENLQQADDANSRGHDLKHVLGVASTCNPAEPFGLGVDFLVWIALSPLSDLDYPLWFTQIQGK